MKYTIGGWGLCLEKNICQTADGFQELHAAMKDMDAFNLINTDVEKNL